MGIRRKALRPPVRRTDTRLKRSRKRKWCMVRLRQSYEVCRLLPYCHTDWRTTGRYTVGSPPQSLDRTVHHAHRVYE